MSRIAEIEAKFSFIQSQNASIKSFVYDEYSRINSILNKQSPLLLLKVPRKSDKLIFKSNIEEYEIKLFIFQPRHQVETNTLSEQFDSLKVLLETAINEFVFYPNVYRIKDTIHYDYMRDEGNSNACVVGATFIAEVFQCRDNTSTGVVTIITNQSGTVVGTATDHLQVIAKDTNNNILTPTYTIANNILTLSGININNSKMIIVDNVNTTAQSNSLIGSYTLANLCIFGAGTEQIGIDNVSSYNATTGTITFNNDMGGMTMRIILIV